VWRTDRRTDGRTPHDGKDRAMQSVAQVITRNCSYRWQTAWRVQRSVKVTKHGTIPHIRYGLLLVCCSNFVRKTKFWGYSIAKITWPLKAGLGVRQGHWRCHHSIEPVWLPIDVLYWLRLCLVSFLRYSMLKIIIATLKSRSRGDQGHWKLYHSIDLVWFLISIL